MPPRAQRGAPGKNCGGGARDDHNSVLGVCVRRRGWRLACFIVVWFYVVLFCLVQEAQGAGARASPWE